MVATVAPLYEEDRSKLGADGLPELCIESMMPSVVSVSSPSPLPTAEYEVDEQATYADDTPQVIDMRPMVIDDIDQVRELHEQWFPIRYQQNFYDVAAQGVWRETGFPLFTRLAAEQHRPTQPSPLEDEYNNAFGFMQWSPRPPTVYGAVMASMIPLTAVEDHGLVSADDYTHTHVMYILTLGSRAAVRRRGVASALLAECVAEARRQPRCGAVYLHVKADNMSALRFYEKNGFQNLRYLEDYYVIDGVRHSAYLYILYVNGAQPQSNWLELLTRPIVALFTMASQGLKRLMVGILEESQKSRLDANGMDKVLTDSPRKAQSSNTGSAHTVSRQPPPTPTPLPSSPAIISCV